MSRIKSYALVLAGIFIGCGTHSAGQAMLTARAERPVVPVPAEQSSSAIRIAVVDMQEAVLAMDGGREASAKLRAYTSAKQEELDAQQAAIFAETESIEQDAKRGTSAAALQPRRDALAARTVALQLAFIKHNKELQKRQEVELRPLMKKLFATMNAMPEYDVVIDKAAVPRLRPDLEITDEVVAAANRTASPP